MAPRLGRGSALNWRKRVAGGAAGPGGGAARALPSQEGQQGPGRGWAQGAGGQGSRWQDTEPSRQRQRRQGSPGGEKCCWWRTGTNPPGCGQLEGEAEARGPASRGAQRGAAEGALAGRTRQGVQLLPGHCGQHSPGRRTGSAHASRGQWRVRHCTLPRCTDRWTTTSRVSGGRPRGRPPFPSPTGVDLSWPPQVPPLLPRPSLPIQVADSPDSGTAGRGQRGGGSRLRWGTLSHQKRSLGEGQL